MSLTWLQRELREEPRHVLFGPGAGLFMELYYHFIMPSRNPHVGLEGFLLVQHAHGARRVEQRQIKGNVYGVNNQISRLISCRENCIGDYRLCCYVLSNIGDEFWLPNDFFHSLGPLIRNQSNKPSRISSGFGLILPNFPSDRTHIPSGAFGSPENDKHELVAKCGNLTLRIVMFPRLGSHTAVSGYSHFVLRKINVRNATGIDFGTCSWQRANNQENSRKIFHLKLRDSETSFAFGRDSILTLSGNQVFISWDRKVWYEVILVRQTKPLVCLVVGCAGMKIVIRLKAETESSRVRLLENIPILDSSVVIEPFLAVSNCVTFRFRNSHRLLLFGLDLREYYSSTKLAVLMVGIRRILREIVSETRGLASNSDIESRTLSSISENGEILEPLDSLRVNFPMFKDRCFLSIPSTLVQPHLCLNGFYALLCCVRLLLDIPGSLAGDQHLPQSGDSKPFRLLAAALYFSESVIHDAQLLKEYPNGDHAGYQEQKGKPYYETVFKRYMPEIIPQCFYALCRGVVCAVCSLLIFSALLLLNSQHDLVGIFWASLLVVGALFLFHFAIGLIDQIEISVPRKYPLTSTNYRGTVMAMGRAQMANVLDGKKQVAIISALAEGSSIRSIERITGVHRDTIMRLGVRVGKGCANVLDHKMRNLPCRHLEFDEIWGFIGKKERHMQPEDDPQLGDVWTFCAIDADTKLVPSFKVGKRDAATANAFVSDVAGRLKNRVQISSDALRAYVEAVEQAFGANVDFAQIVKAYVFDESADRHYSAPEIVITEKRAVAGRPDMDRASTSYVERLNGTTRLHMRRLTRLTYAFSKKLENFEAAVALHFAYYNFVKRHSTLRATPAMAAGIERDFWTVENLVEAAA
jgi:IS1 family transposase